MSKTPSSVTTGLTPTATPFMFYPGRRENALLTQNMKKATMRDRPVSTGTFYTSSVASNETN